ncbi:two-component system sensor histidine kinase NtrB [Desulfohalovibrio reitneri]|uniref:two-component system sensor histidine kinase NtrB n=1 Tax=Desulfohalovibrio reitneri TaxID=1307759 RepID=UPI00068CE9EA|nr:ATP-binding protein [Desulfohalovibrio reitneri]
MEFRLDRGGLPTWLAWAAIAAACLAVTAVTWDGVRRQRHLMEEHLELASEVVARGVRGGLTRRFMGPGMMGHMGHMGRNHMREGRERRPPPDGTEAADPDILATAGAFFREVAGESDVRFMALLGRDGRQLAVLRGEGSEAVDLPPGAARALDVRERWSGFLPGQEVYMTIIPGGRVLSNVCSMDPGMGCEPGGREPIHLAVGLGAGEFMEGYRGARRTAWLTTGFTAGAGGLLIFMGAAYARRREAGRRLAALERVHHGLLDAMPDGLLRVDASGDVTAANAAARDMLGGEAVGRPLAEVMPGVSLCRGASHMELSGRRLEVIRKELPGEGGCLMLLRDRTEVGRLEAELARSERLAAVGRLAAGVAHEVRNPLSSLRGFAQFFRKKFAGRAPEEEYAETMVREADRLNKVISDLLFMARPAPRDLAPVDLAEAASEIERLLIFDLEEKGVELETDFQAPEARADPGSLRQALLNLVMNALTAVDEGGRIRIGSREVDGGVEVSVADNGRGMDAETLERAREPFYTTRAEGTGLGLAIVSAVAEGVGGRLDIDSKPGEGTTMRLFFPNEPETGGEAA